MAPLPGRKRRSDQFLQATLPALDLVYNLAGRLVDADDVEDVVQETFTREYGAWMRGRPPRKVEPWLGDDLSQCWSELAASGFDAPGGSNRARSNDGVT